MKFTEEQIKKLGGANTEEELVAIAAEEGIEASAEEIKAQFDALHKNSELNDDELGNVAGGCGGGDDDSEPKSNVPPAAPIDSATKICPNCGATLEFERTESGGFYKYSDDKGRYDMYICSNCGGKFRHHWTDDYWTYNS